jgi:hypothetical protein
MIDNFDTDIQALTNKPNKNKKQKQQTTKQCN